MHEFSDHFVFWSKKQLSLEVFSSCEHEALVSNLCAG